MPERDGLDVFGLLVGRHSSAIGPCYVFIVGVGRASGLSARGSRRRARCRLTLKSGVATWETGPRQCRSADALSRWRRSLDHRAIPGSAGSVPCGRLRSGRVRGRTPHRRTLGTVLKRTRCVGATRATAGATGTACSLSTEAGFASGRVAFGGSTRPAVDRCQPAAGPDSDNEPPGPTAMHRHR